MGEPFGPPYKPGSQNTPCKLGLKLLPFEVWSKGSDHKEKFLKQEFHYQQEQYVKVFFSFYDFKELQFISKFGSVIFFLFFTIFYVDKVLVNRAMR